MSLSGSPIITPEVILEDADLNDTATETGAVDISTAKMIFMQVLTEGVSSIVTLQVSGTGEEDTWEDHFTFASIMGKGALCVFPVVAFYARLKVTVPEGSPQLGTLILQAK